MSEYAQSLEKDVLSRYAQKIASINSVDPYTIPNEVFANEKNVAPTLEIVDIMNYYVCTHSLYTGDQIKSYKALDAYEYLTAGLVGNVKYAKISENYIVLGDVSIILTDVLN